MGQQPYHLSPAEIASFDENGYLILRQRIPAPMLRRLQDATARLIAAGKAADGLPEDYQVRENAMFRIDYLHDKGEPATLELLGSPAVLGIAESLSGPNFVPTYETVVFKDEGDGAAIEWHQDAVHPRRHRIYNIDVYLDASRKGAGALRVVPGSQRGKVDICELRDGYGWTPPESFEVELDAGDVLIHDVMTVHGSEPTEGKALRRTIYYEFRAAEQILAEGPWEREWVDQRLSFLPLALAEHARANPDTLQFAWQAAPEYRPDVDPDTDLRILHLKHTGGSYCSAGSVPLPKANDEGNATSSPAMADATSDPA